MYLVTGATGFLGSALVEELTKRGQKVRIMTRSNTRSNKFEVYSGDVTNLSDVEKAMKNCSGVFHLAVHKGQLGPYELHYKTNVIGTENVLEVAEKMKIKVVVMSTMAVTLNLSTPYIKTKQKQEEVVKRFWKKIVCPIIRAPRIYDKETVAWFKKLARFAVPKIDAKEYLIYRESVVSALISAMKSGKSKIYQIADKNPILFTDLIKTLNPKILWLPAATVEIVAFLLYPVKWFSEIFKLTPFATPDYLRAAFAERDFQPTRGLKYKRFDTLEMFKRISKSLND